MASMNGDSLPIFYIGHYNQKRDYPITEDVIELAGDYGYDLLTAPITTSALYSRVSAILSRHTPHDHSTAAQVHDHPVLQSLDCASSDRCETHLWPSSDLSHLILTSSFWIDLASPDPLIADVSRQVFSLEIQYASFCGAPNIFVRGPRVETLSHDGLSQYARAIQEALWQARGTHIHISFSMTEQSNFEDSIFDLSAHVRPQYRNDKASQDDDAVDPMASWDAWNFIRSFCNYSTRLHAALSVPAQLPPTPVVSKWFSESVHILEVPKSSFVKHNRENVALSKEQQQFLFRFARKVPTPWILLRGIGELPQLHVSNGKPEATLASFNTPSDPTPAEALQQSSGAAGNVQSPTPHLDCLRRLQSKQPTRDAIENYATGYQDYLQDPLQPLANNLESLTYDVFETDPIKYEWYERAIAAALLDWKKEGKPASGRNGSVCIAVVGAGRGPLVTRALNASKSAGVPVDVWALEKNPNAFVLLQRYFNEKWNRSVSLARSDMRSWGGPFYYTEDSAQDPSHKVHFSVDILVSELLGSFGDNELSPECLDGVQHLLAPTYGISIPSSYTAHLTPIAAPKVHGDILYKTACGDKNASEVPYVVFLRTIDYLSTHLPAKHPDRAKNPAAGTPRPEPVPNIQQAWAFEHPNPAVVGGSQGGVAAARGNEHNRRFAKLEFRCRERGVCHGLAGYFETVLYEPKAATSSIQEPAGLPKTPTGSSSQQNSIPGQKVELSTNPLTMDAKSKDMISWFPIFFPLKTPLYFPDSSLLTVSMWRQTDGRKVWYEWMVESFLLQGSGAGNHQRKVRLGSTELHSSTNTGCLL